MFSCLKQMPHFNFEKESFVENASLMLILTNQNMAIYNNDYSWTPILIFEYQHNKNFFFKHKMKAVIFSFPISFDYYFFLFLMSI